MILLAFSAAQGLAKGLAFPEAQAPQGYDLVVGPTAEEVAFRWLPVMANPGISPLVTASAFAVAHAAGPTPGMLAFRTGDAFIGGLVYHYALLRYGFLGAVVAHILHNTAVGIGQTARRANAVRQQDVLSNVG